MKLVLHWVAKDLRRLRGWVVAWGALVALPILVGIDVLRAEPLPSDWRRYREVLDWLNGLQALLGYIVTLLLVQEDRAIDARAFWPTRPMAAGRLLAAKLVFVLLVGVALPFLIQLPWWLACGVEPEGMASAMAEWTLLAFTIALPAALVAALTDSLGRAILWSFVVISAAVMVPMFGSLIRPTLSPRAWEAGLLALLLSLALVLAAMAVAVALLYRKRRYSRALGAVAAVTVLGVMAVRILAGFWRVDREPAPWRPERAEAVVVTLHDAFSTATASRGAPEPLRQVRTGFAATNVPVDRALLGITSHQRWQWPGLALERDGLLAVLGRSGVPGLPGLTAPAPDPETAAWQVEERARARRSGPRLLSQSTPPTEGIWIQANALAPASFAARMERDPPAYAARLWFTLVRPTLVNEQRLEGGAWQTGEAHAMRVVETKDRGVDVVVTLVDAARASPWWRNVEVSILRARGQDARAAAGFLLLNRERRESVGLFEEQQRALVVAGAQLTWRRLVTRQLAQLRAPNWETRPGWLDGASIAHVRSEREAVFRRDVSHPALPVKGASTEP